MKQTYHFVGSSASVGNLSFQLFGRTYQFEPEQAEKMALDGVALIPQEKFEEIGFDPNHLRKYAAQGTWQLAPAEFDQKRAQANAAYCAWREELRSGPQVPKQPVKPILAFKPASN